MKTKKHLLALLLSFALILSILTGCASDGGSSSQSVDPSERSTATDGTGGSDSPGINFDEPPYEINFLYWVASEGANQQKVAEAVSELALRELNMSVNLIPMTIGTYFAQISLMLAANESLDLFPVMSNNFSTYIESQYIVNMHDYLQYAPDAMRVLGSDALVADIGGFLTGFTQMKERAYPAGLIVRKDIFEELGYSVSDFDVNVNDYSSFDKLTEMFANVKENYPGMIPFDGSSIMGLQVGSYIDNMGSNFGVLENYGQTTTVTNWFESDQFRIFCEIARDWFVNGYSSSDIAVNQDSGEIKMMAGNCFSYMSNVKPNTDVEKLAQTGYEVVVIPVSEVMKYTGAVTAAVYSIANASKDPAKAMQFLNWTYVNGEFNDLINWGIEGEDWIRTPEGLAAYPPGVDANSVGYHNNFGWIYPNQFAGTPWEGNPIDIWQQYEIYNSNLMVSESYGFTFDSTPVFNEEAMLNTVFDQYSDDVAFGAVEIEPALKAFNDALYAAGLQRVIDEKQKQLDDWLANR